MMFCPHCGARLFKKKIKFCTRCGCALKFVSEVLALLDVPPPKAFVQDESKRRLTIGYRAALILIWTILLTLIGNLTGELLFRALKIFQKSNGKIKPPVQNESAQIYVPPMGAWREDLSLSAEMPVTIRDKICPKNFPRYDYALLNVGDLRKSTN